MAAIEMRGIDRDGESRLMSFEHLSPDVLAEALCLEGWKYAQLRQAGKVVGVVALDPCLLRRTWWGKAPLEQGP